MDQTLSVVSYTRLGCCPLPMQPAQRTILYPGELYRVPAWYDLLRIVSGLAYVTQAGQDHILASGHELQLMQAADIVLVSCIGSEPAVIEIFEAQNYQKNAALFRLI